MPKAALILPGSDEALAYAESRFGESRGRLAAEAYVKYQELLEERALLTYDDFLVFAWQHLSADDQVRRRWAARWQYVLQDEGQDANRAQVVIAEMIARDHRNYMIVGDVAQSIFGFRGSKPEYLCAVRRDVGRQDDLDASQLPQRSSDRACREQRYPECER